MISNSNSSNKQFKLQAIIDSFSNKELGDLLGIPIIHQHVVASGLRQRALSLLETSFPTARRKIREILENRKVTTQPPLTSQMYHQDVNMVLSQQGNNGATNHANGTNNGVVVYNQNTPQPTQPQSNIVLKKLAFFEVMGTLLRPTELFASHAQRVQECNYSFTLSPQQANEISLNRWVLSLRVFLFVELCLNLERVFCPFNRDTRNVSKPEFLVQVQLRFCSIEPPPSCEQQDDYFPPNIVVKVNAKMCPLPVRMQKYFSAERNDWKNASQKSNFSESNTD